MPNTEKILHMKLDQWYDSGLIKCVVSQYGKVSLYSEWYHCKGKM